MTDKQNAMKCESWKVTRNTEGIENWIALARLDSDLISRLSEISVKKNDLPIFVVQEPSNEDSSREVSSSNSMIYVTVLVFVFVAVLVVIYLVFFR